MLKFNRKIPTTTFLPLKKCHQTRQITSLRVEKDSSSSHMIWKEIKFSFLWQSWAWPWFYTNCLMIYIFIGPFDFIYVNYLFTVLIEFYGLFFTLWMNFVCLFVIFIAFLIVGNFVVIFYVLCSFCVYRLPRKSSSFLTWGINLIVNV